VMAKARIGHFVEAQVLCPRLHRRVRGPDSAEAHHIDKAAFSVPFVCVRGDELREALRRIGEG